MDKKYIQIALNDKKEGITFDQNTGLTDNEFTYYAEADKNANGYDTLLSARMGLGLYTVYDDGSITVDIQVLGNYEEAENESLIGYLHSNMIVYDGSFRVKPKTISFVPADGKEIDDPREISE